MAEVQKGTYLNVLSIENIDTKQPYWNQSIVDQFTINGYLYTLTGSISPELIGQSIVFFENKKVAEDRKIENIYDVVLNNAWTHEKLNTIVKDLYSDENGSNTRDKDDFFGLTMPLNSQVDAFYASYKLHITEKDNEGNLVFAFRENEVIDVYDKLVELLINNDGVWAKKDYKDDYGTDYLVHFAADKALFTVNRLNSVSKTLTDMSSDFAILPYPKASADQDNYYTYVWNQYSVISIPNDVSSREKSGAGLEILSSTSYNIVTPAYYEVALKNRYSRDNTSSQMLDIITQNTYIEFCHIFSSDIIFYLRNKIKAGVTSIASEYAATYKGNSTSIKNAIKKWPESK